MGNGRIYGLLSALLFAAACAYLGAALYGALQRPRPVPAPAENAGAGARLQGIILRHEETLSPAMALQLSGEEEKRLPAKDSLAGGTLLPRSDGYEYLSPEDGFELSPGKLDALLAAQPEPGRGPKLVYGFEQYYAAFYEGDASPAPGPCRLRFQGMEETFRGEIISVSAENSRCAVLIRLTADQSKITFRRTEAELIYSD